MLLVEEIERFHSEIMNRSSCSKEFFSSHYISLIPHQRIRKAVIHGISTFSPELSHTFRYQLPIYYTVCNFVSNMCKRYWKNQAKFFFDNLLRTRNSQLFCTFLNQNDSLHFTSIYDEKVVQWKISPKQEVIYVRTYITYQ